MYIGDVTPFLGLCPSSRSEGRWWRDGRALSAKTHSGRLRNWWRGSFPINLRVLAASNFFHRCAVTKELMNTGGEFGWYHQESFIVHLVPSGRFRVPTGLSKCCFLFVCGCLTINTNSLYLFCITQSSVRWAEMLSMRLREMCDYK